MVDSVQIQEWLGTSHLIEDLKSNISFYFLGGKKYKLPFLMNTANNLENRLHP
jgi:hypothetical protein